MLEFEFRFQIIRLIKHDIRINSGPKHILEALSKDAYPAYQSSRNLGYVVAKYGDSIRSNKLDSGGAPKIKKVTYIILEIFFIIIIFYHQNKKNL